MNDISRPASPTLSDTNATLLGTGQAKVRETREQVLTGLAKGAIHFPKTSKAEIDAQVKLIISVGAFIVSGLVAAVGSRILSSDDKSNFGFSLLCLGSLGLCMASYSVSRQIGKLERA